MQKLQRFPYHSFLLSVYPIAHLYARNIMYIPLGEISRSVAASLGLSILFLGCFWLILREWDRAGLLCSLFVALFFSFGHIASFLEEWASDRGLPFQLSLLGWVWLLAFLLLSFTIVRAKWAKHATGLLNIASVTLVAFPLATIVSTALVKNSVSEAEIQTLARIRGEASAEIGVPISPSPEWPDIYYIVFDGYERADVLKDLYGYDNSEFIEALVRRGFYVPALSRSNYLSTNYSLNTALNLVYFHDLPPRILRNARYNLQTNYVSDFLREHGYRVVVFDSGTRDTNTQYFDEFITPNTPLSTRGSEVNPFERLLLRTTMGLLLLEGGGEGTGAEIPSDTVSSAINQELTIRRERISHALAHLPDYATQEGRYFLFTHIYLPHIPFLYGPSGEELQYHGDLNLYWYEVESDNYTQYYAFQIDYLNHSILQTIDTILELSDKPVVIILQSDHGDGLMLDWDNPTALGVSSRSAILNAIYYSDQSYEELYPTITPVNTFRAVFNNWFETRYPWLPDRVFFHEHPLSTPYNSQPEFFDACALLGICLPLHTE